MQDKTISNIIANSEATMNQVAVNSIAIAILHLMELYYPNKSATEGRLRQARVDCIRFLSQLSAQDFIKEKQGEDNTKLVAELNSQLKPVIQFMIQK